MKDGTFGTLFYVMTGIHMAHVFGGVVFLALVFGQAMGGLLSPSNHDSLAAGAIYWDFVDVDLDAPVHDLLPPHAEVMR